MRLPTKRVAKANHVGAARVEARRGGGTAEPPTLDESLKKLMLRVVSREAVTGRAQTWTNAETD